MLMLSLAGATTSHSSSGDHPATPTTGTCDTTHRCGGLSLATLTRGAPMLSPKLMLMLSLAEATTSHGSSGDHPATPTTGSCDTTHRCGGLNLATLTRGAPMLSPQLMLMLSLAGATTSHSSSGDQPVTPTTGTCDTTHRCGELNLATLTRGALMLSPQLMLMLSLA